LNEPVPTKGVVLNPCLNLLETVPHAMKKTLLCVRKLVDPPQKIEAYYRWRGKTHHRAIRTLQRVWMPFARASGSAVLHKPPMAENFGWARKYQIMGEAILKCPSSVTGTDYHRPSLRRS
jgi:hypothetical protein